MPDRPTLLRRVIRRLPAVLFALAAVLHGQSPTPPAPAAPPELTAETSEFTENEAIARGKAELRDPGLLLTADEIRYNRATDTATARGNVVYTRGPVRLLADEVVVNRTNRAFSAERVRVGSYPYYIEGSSAKGLGDEITVRQARVAYGEPGPWQPTATADVLTFNTSGGGIRTEGAQVGLGGAQPVPFPKLQHSLSDPILSLIRLSGGYRGSLGAFIDAGLHLPIAPGVQFGGDVGYYTERGLMFGPSGGYRNVANPDLLYGIVRSGYINDHGDKKTDVLGRRVPENRGFFQWEHRQLVTPDLSLTGQLNWWKDSEVLRDFRPREFFPVQQPDSFLEATYTQPNFFISVFGRFAPNDFQIVQQRVPEIRFDLLPLVMPGGFVERFHASVAVLRENVLPTPAPGSPAATVFSGTNLRTSDSWTTVSAFPLGTPTELRSTRYDAYYGLSRPIAPNDWFALTPVAGGRVTHYSDTRGTRASGSHTRTLGEFGFDLEMRTSGTFAYKNEAWRIDGLRHVFTPRISYRSIPGADRGRAEIPPIDRQTFSTYLQPLSLGDIRALDELPPTQTLRVELDNLLQTRDAKLGSRDLLALNLAQDFRFKRRPGERDLSDLHAELAAMPARWLEFGLYSRYGPQTGKLQELNSGVTLRDGRYWRVRFANNFLRGQLEDYLLDGHLRINESYEALAVLRYDQRRHRFTEQTYGVVQNLANTWRISYLVSFYSGRRRESGFGFSVQIDTVRF